MSYSSDWNYNDDSVYIPSPGELTQDEKTRFLQRQQDLQKAADNLYREHAVKVLQEIEKGGYEALKVSYNSRVESTINGVDYIEFTRYNINGFFFDTIIFNEEICNRVFGDDAAQVLDIFKTMLAVKINKLIKQGDIKNHSSVNKTNIGKVDSQGFVGLSIQIV